MEFMTAKEAAEKWGITPRRVQTLCAEGRISGAWRLGNAWAIPVNAEKPRDVRTLSKDSIAKRREND
ncbi:MAG: helix-turn-helix domain-containing protein [Syntrophomonas sp.]